MTWDLHRHDARRVSELLEPNSVDLIVTSPPYFALRSYRDGGEHFAGQLGSEASPSEFVDALIECTRDWLKVLKPTGSLFVNLGDKYSGAGGPGGDYNPGGLRDGQPRGGASEYWAKMAPANNGIPAKSKMGLPWRYALRCVDELGLILRSDIIWSKPNGLPESVQDRVRGSHEYLFHFTRQGRYFAAIDEVREPTEDIGRKDKTVRAGPLVGNHGSAGHDGKGMRMAEVYNNPLGKVPGSVWTIPSEPLQVPKYRVVVDGRHVAYPATWDEARKVMEPYARAGRRPSLRTLGDHFAAFPSELPRRCILGWTPSGWCLECGEPRRPIVDKTYETIGNGRGNERYDRLEQGHGDIDRGAFKPQEMPYGRAEMRTAIVGYLCAPDCPGEAHCPTRPAVVLDPFAGTGTTVAVAHHLGRHGIGTDLSADYLRLAEWRCTHDTRLRSKVLDRTGIPNPEPPAIDGQLDLFAEGA